MPMPMPIHRTRTICCKRAVDDQEVLHLATTQRAFNEAATWEAQVCWKEGLSTTTTTTAHHRVYGQTRAQFGVGAPLAICARMQAVEASKARTAKGQGTCRVFGPRGSVRYDARSATLLGHGRVWLTTGNGRITCCVVLGERHLTLLKDPACESGGADLVWRRGVYYLHVTQSRAAPAPAPAATLPAGDVLGVDLGIVHLATDSEGQHFTGARIHVARTRYHAQRRRLQQRGTRSARKRLRRVGGREARCQKDTHHCSSKALVTKAVVARKARALEALSGSRERTTVRRAHRYVRHSWAFFQLRAEIAYKAAWSGVRVLLVDPRTTSRSWSHCGQCDTAKRNSPASGVAPA